MNYRECHPPAPLAPYVRCFWFLRDHGGIGAPQPIIADGRIEIVLHLAEPFFRVHRDGAAFQQSDTLIAGQLTNPLFVRSNGNSDVVGIRFRTAAANAILKVPLAELTDRVEPLADAEPELAAALFGAAAKSSVVEERVSALSVVLLARIRAEAGSLSRRAVHAFVTNPNTRSAIVARKLGVSTRTLERHTLQATGLAPTPLRRVLRFREAYKLLERAPSGTAATVAAQAGYYDQAHLIRDFRQFAGMSPAAYFATDPTLASSLIGSGASDD